MALLLISAQGEWTKMGDSEKEQPKIGPLDWLGLSNLPNLQCAKPLGALLGAYLVGLFIVALFATMAVLMSTFSSLDSDTGPSLGVGTLIIGVLGAPFLIWRTMVAQTTVDLAKENHVTDMINKAVEGLGAIKSVKTEGNEKPEPNIEVRIGAILALERLAKNNLDVHIQIMEILTAYIRENAKASEAPPLLGPDGEPLPECPRYETAFADVFEVDLKEWNDKLRAALKAVKPRADIQMALTVIGRREDDQKTLERNGVPEFSKIEIDSAIAAGVSGDVTGWGPEMNSYRNEFHKWMFEARRHTLDLQGVNLRGADFVGGDFQNSRLTGSLLQGAKLNSTHMEGAFLEHVHMEGADLTEVHFEVANLREAQLQGAGLWNADVKVAHLRGADLVGASLGWTQMIGAYLGETNMQGALLRAVNMKGALLIGTHLEGARIAGARMEGVFLDAAHMAGVIQLDATGLRGAAVKDMDFTYTPDIWVHVPLIFGDGSVTLPGGIRPGNIDWPKHWGNKRLGREEHDGYTVELFDKTWHTWLATLPVEPTPPSP